MKLDSIYSFCSFSPADVTGGFQGVTSNCLALSKLYRWRVNVETKLAISKVYVT